MAKLKPAKLLPRKTRSHACPDETIGKALIANGGRLSHSAEALGLSRTAIVERIDKSPYLQQIKQDCLEKRIDGWEKALQQLVEDKSLGAVCFGLKTLGRTRGYTETSAIYVAPELANSMRAMMEQIAAYQEARKISNINAKELASDSSVTNEDSEGPE